MDRIMGVATGVAVVAMAKKHGSSKRDGSFGKRLIAEGGDAAALGQQWDEGMSLIAQGHRLSGWFVGRKQNKKAEALVLKGIAMKNAAEKAYEALPETKDF